jgi:hypothetical protein
MLALQEPSAYSNLDGARFLVMGITPSPIVSYRAVFLAGAGGEDGLERISRTRVHRRASLRMIAHR